MYAESLYVLNAETKKSLAGKKNNDNYSCGGGGDDNDDDNNNQNHIISCNNRMNNLFKLFNIFLTI